MSQRFVSSHSSQSATSKAPLLIEVDTGSSPSLGPRPVHPSLGVSSRPRSRHSLPVKELNCTTSESSKTEGTPEPQVDALVAPEGNPDGSKREVGAFAKVAEPPAVVWPAST